MDIETIEFRVTRIVHDEGGDFRIVAGESPGDRSKRVTAKGNLGEVHKGDVVTAQGVWRASPNPRYGMQFEVISASVLPNDKAGFVGWAEARLPNLGEKRATEIWKAYGSRIWGLLKAGDSSPLVALKGITPARAQDILDAYRKHAAEAEQVQPLMDYGFGLADAKKIVRFFGVNTAKTLGENPYRFASLGDIKFEKVDALTRDAGMPRDAWQRVNGKAVDILRKLAKAEGATRADGHALKPAYQIARGDKGLFMEALERGEEVVPAGRGFMGLKAPVEAEKTIAAFMGLSEDGGTLSDVLFG